MAKLIDQYLAMRDEIRMRIQAGSLTSEELLAAQELNYRINVLETMQLFCKTAPNAAGGEAVNYHYQLMKVYVSKMLTEHQLGSKSDEEGKKKKETALTTLSAVCTDGFNRFWSNQSEVTDWYRKEVSKLINVILAAWIQYRNAYVALELSSGREQAPKNGEPPMKKVQEVPPAKDSEEAEFEAACAVLCPIKKYAGKTLGEVMTLEPKALTWLVSSYDGDPSVKAAAKTICEYAARMSA